MKKYTFLLVALACLCGCMTELAPEETGAGPVRTTLQASLADITKTAVDGTKLTWSAGDEVVVNGSR